MRPCLLTLLTLVGLFACRPLQEGTATPPSEIIAVGIISDGEGSPLEAWPAGAPLPIVTRGSGPHFVYGYTAAQLEPLGEGWRNGRLRPSAPCEASLPSAAWVGRIDGATLSTVQEGFEASITVDGLRSICPSPSELPLLLDVRDETERCSHRILRDGCKVDVLTECGAGDFSGWVHPDGGFCLEQTREVWSCEAGPLRPGVSLQCKSGTRELELLDATPAPAPFELQTLSLGPGEPFETRLWALSRQLYATDTDSGYVHGMVALSDRLVVSHTMASEGGDCWSQEDQPTMLSVIDPDRLEVIGQVVAPRCTTELIADASGQSFVAFVRLDNDRYGLSRFDADGNLLMTETIAGSSAWGRVPQGLRAVESKDHLLFFMPPTTTLPGLQLRVHRRSDLGQVETATITNVPRVLAVSWLDDDNAVVVDSNDTFAHVDIARRTIVDFGSYLEDQLYPGRFVSGYAPAPRELVLTMNGPAESTLFHWQSGGGAQIRLPLEPELALSVVTGWPDGRWLVAGIDAGQSERSTAFALYDPVQARFQPGVWRVSRGIASLPVWDAAGRLWIVHPWANEISRLTPR